MNHARILRFTNGLLMLIGYQLYHYNGKTQKFRLSLWVIGHFVLMSAFYLIAFAHHFEPSALMNLMQSISPFLRRLMGIQLLCGMKVFLLEIYEQRLVIRATSELAATLPKVYAKQFTAKEAYAYFLNYSTIFNSLAITFYVAYEMDFELPALDSILVFCGLFIPHFVLGGAMKLYNVGIWLQREQLWDFHSEFRRIIEVEEHIDRTLLTLENGQKAPVKVQDLSSPLHQLHTQLSQWTKAATIFNSTLQRQILVLVLLNCNCLLAGTYARVYYEKTWHLLFLKRTRNVFQATNCGIFILIFWDYFTMFLTQILFENVKQIHTNEVNKAIKQRDRFTDSTHHVLTDIHDLLKEGSNLKVLHIIKWSLPTFFVMQILVGLIVALIVVYQYLDDQILELSERFDGIGSGDD